MEKIFSNYKGVVVFYLILILLAFISTIRIKGLNNQASSNNTTVVESVVA